MKLVKICIWKIICILANAAEDKEVTRLSYFQSSYHCYVNQGA